MKWRLTAVLWLRFGGCLTLLFFQLKLSGALVVVPPNADTQLNGNAFAAPFDPAEGGRFQQVFNSGAFGAIAGAGGGWVRSISFRLDPALATSFQGVISNLQINLSTTPRAIDSLSAVFAENTGADNLQVMGPGEVAISAGSGFSFNFLLANPFFYDPSQGNLLVDFRIFEGLGHGRSFPVPSPPPPPSAILDAFNVVGDSVSSVYAQGPGIPTVGAPSTLGLATLFGITPVPEPSTWTLTMAVALATWSSRNRWRKQPKDA